MIKSMSYPLFRIADYIFSSVYESEQVRFADPRGDAVHCSAVKGILLYRI